MRIHEIIREKRKEQGLTQEQAAGRLGISASAFNKWERGMTCPDIMILPALARLLEVDLNTLLSFEEDLTDQEIGVWCSQISDCIMKEGFSAGYTVAMEKIRRFPNSGMLLYTMAATLEGGLTMFADGAGDEGERQRYLDEIEGLYERAARGKNEAARMQAVSMLASKLMNRGEYEEAREKLELLPERNFPDKNQLLARLYFRQGNYAEAARITENKILAAANDIYSSLFMLMDIALEEERISDAEYFAGKMVQTVNVFEMWDYSACAAEFTLAVKKQDKEEVMRVLKKMFPALEKKWKPCDSLLYSHISEKEGGERRQEFGRRFLKNLAAELQEDKDMEFIKEDEVFQKFLKRYKGEK